MQFDAVSRARAGRLQAGAEVMARTRKPLVKALVMQMRNKASQMIAGTQEEKEAARDSAGRIRDWAAEQGVEDLKVPEL